MKKQSKKNINESTWPGSFIPEKIRMSFKNNVRNAAQTGGPNAVERFVKMFYDRYHDKVMNKEFTLQALMNYARSIEGDEMGSMHINPFAVGQEPGDIDYIEHMHESRTKVKLTESQIRDIVMESVKRILKEYTKRK